MKGIIMMIDSTKMNIMNNNIAHHPHLHHLLNTVLEFDQNYYHIEFIQKIILRESTYNAPHLQKRLLWSKDKTAMPYIVISPFGRWGMVKILWDPNQS